MALQRAAQMPPSRAYLQQLLVQRPLVWCQRRVKSRNLLQCVSTLLQVPPQQAFQGREAEHASTALKRSHVEGGVKTVTHFWGEKIFYLLQGVPGVCSLLLCFLPVQLFSLQRPLQDNIRRDFPLLNLQKQTFFEAFFRSVHQSKIVYFKIDDK